jgi:hypothetical protein
MSLRLHTRSRLLPVVIVVALATAVTAQTPESFTATAAIKAAGGAAATAPVTIEITRKMSQPEVDKLTAAFTAGGVAGLRKSLAGVPPTGSIRIGTGTPTPTRLTIERQTDQGRMLTIVTDRPLLFLGGGLPGAKAKEGFDFGVVDFVIDAKGAGAGTISLAAKVTVQKGAFVVEEYSGELVRLTDVKKTK